MCLPDRLVSERLVGETLRGSESHQEATDDLLAVPAKSAGQKGE